MTAAPQQLPTLAKLQQAASLQAVVHPVEVLELLEPKNCSFLALAPGN